MLTWTGNLAPGDTATITYSITVDNPDNGDKHLVTTVVSTDPGSTCPPGSANPACTATVTDLIPALTITKTANVASAAPGTAVDYTITVADTGQTPYTGATVTDDLTGVLERGRLQRRRRRHHRHRLLRQPHPHLDRRPRAGRHGHHHLLGHHQQPRDRRHQPDQHRRPRPRPAAAARRRPTGGPCAVTTGVITGPLSITAPASADLGSGAPGTTIPASLGTVQVTDGRGFGADWTATVSSSDFTTGGGSPAETIPVGDASYAISGLTTATGPATFGSPRSGPAVTESRPMTSWLPRPSGPRRGRDRHMEPQEVVAAAAGHSAR